jgi:hypothetical protein
MGDGEVRDERKSEGVEVGGWKEESEVDQGSRSG